MLLLHTQSRDTRRREKKKKRHENEVHVVVFLRIFVNGTRVEVFAQM